MAFSKDLEDVIEAAIADGVISDKEREVLHKKALLEGVDPDELDVVIDGRLAKMKKEEDWLRPTPPQNLSNEKRGNVVKCPNCGAQVEAGSGKCSECGYVFTNMKANSVVTQFARDLEAKIATCKKDKKGWSDFSDYDVEAVSSFIVNYPIPSGKEEMIEFVTLMYEHSAGADDFSSAYEAKYKSCINKCKIMYVGDPQIEAMVKLIEEKESKAEAEQKDALRKLGYMVLALFAIIGVVILCWWLKQ